MAALSEQHKVLVVDVGSILHKSFHFVEYVANVNCKNSTGNAPLIWASSHDHTEIMAMIVVPTVHSLVWDSIHSAIVKPTCSFWISF
jgi:hypothetical protein